MLPLIIAAIAVIIVILLIRRQRSLVFTITDSAVASFHSYVRIYPAIAKQLTQCSGIDVTNDANIHAFFTWDLPAHPVVINMINSNHGVLGMDAMERWQLESAHEDYMLAGRCRGRASWLY